MTGFKPPAYPYDRLAGIRRVAARHEGGAIDLSVGTPGDDPPRSALEALAAAAAGSAAALGEARGYPPSAGTAELRDAAAAWAQRSFGVKVPPSCVGACVGTKELVAMLPQWLKLRSPERDTVAFPELAYPTYEMGARLAGLRPLPVKLGADGRMLLASVPAGDLERSLVIFANSPGNPAGQLDDLGGMAEIARHHGTVLASDECYASFTWASPPRSVLQAGTTGVLALHSLSKRSNLAGLRVGFYAGDPELVAFLSEVRKHAGLMVPGPVQAAAVAALSDEAHVEAQRQRYLERFEVCRRLLAAAGARAPLPEGGIYLWAEIGEGYAGEGRAWSFASRLAERAGVVVAPGDIYGPAGAGHVRAAMVVPVERLELAARRLGASLPA